MIENEITEKIIGCSIEVHRTLGPGLLESAYVECLAFELLKCNLTIQREKPIPLVYKDVKLDCGYRADLMVEDRIIIEAKSVQALSEIHLAQLLTYLKLTDCKLGLLINFNSLRLKDGIKRVVNNFY